MNWWKVTFRFFRKKSRKNELLKLENEKRREWKDWGGEQWVGFVDQEMTDGIIFILVRLKLKQERKETSFSDCLIDNDRFGCVNRWYQIEKEETSTWFQIGKQSEWNEDQFECVHICFSRKNIDVICWIWNQNWQPKRRLEKQNNSYYINYYSNYYWNY